MLNRNLTEDQTQIRQNFIGFFDSDIFREKYDVRLREMMRTGKNRMIVDIGDMLTHDEGSDNNLGMNLISDPATYLPICELAVHDLVIRKQPEYLKVDYRQRNVHVGFEGPIDQILSPRELYARHLNRMVAIEGIITRQSALRPRIVETVHFCAATNKFSRKEYRDQLSPLIDSAHLPTVNVMPLKDMNGNNLRTELGLSQFVDSQCAILQEAPESAPAGQLPRSVELRLDDDLVDGVKPGDRVVVVGMYRPYTAKDGKVSNRDGFQTILLVNHIYLPQVSIKVPRLFPALEDEIKRFALRHQARCHDGVLRVLSRSVAPAIYGLTMEKKAILLLMAGGVERRAHHSHIRGDVNVLLVGEPSTAKSQLLRFILGVVPHALSTTGKGSSGVGLTAAVAVDQYSGERSLSAGAMVLADRGILCVDEFDKMSHQDRVAMHEAMEQQTVTIAKAGISASLNARCSVVAAANPTYGSYSTKHSIEWNIGLPESLLSRFDLTFVILDKHSAQHNRRTGTHILQNHMRAEAVPFNSQNVQTVVGNGDNEGNNNNNNATGGGGGDMFGSGSDIAQENAALINSVRAITAQPPDQVVPLSFLRRYLQVAKGISPLLTENSQRLVSENFATIRSEQVARGGYAITYRTLDSMIRLATAHAKLRLSQEVSEEDVLVATQLVRSSALISQVSAASRNEEPTNEDAGPDNNSNNNNNNNDDYFGPALGQGATASSAAQNAAQQNGSQMMMMDDNMENNNNDNDEDRFRTRARRLESDQQENDYPDFGDNNNMMMMGSSSSNNQSQRSNNTTTNTTTSTANNNNRNQQQQQHQEVDISIIQPILEDILNRLQREQRTEVDLDELQDRIQQRLGSGEVSLRTLKNLVSQLDESKFMFDDSSDTVYFV